MCDRKLSVHIVDVKMKGPFLHITSMDFPSVFTTLVVYIYLLNINYHISQICHILLLHFKLKYKKPIILRAFERILSCLMLRENILLVWATFLSVANFLLSKIIIFWIYFWVTAGL